jgi:hypothetical protein
MMPAAIPIITLIAGALSIGEGIYSLTNRPSTPQLPSSLTQATSTGGPSTDQRQTALRAALANIQSGTGGSLTPQGLASESAVQSGQADQQNLALQTALQYLGLRAPGLTSESGGLSSGSVSA